MKEFSVKKRSKKRGKSKNKEFMDAALDAFIRDQSLKKWNEVEGFRVGANLDYIEAVKSSSNFFEKGPYFQIWKRWWQKDVIDNHFDNKKHLFAKIENAVRGAVMEECELRKKNSQILIEDSFEYKEFVARQMDHLLHEAGGDIEEEIY